MVLGTLPYEHGVEVAHLQIKALVFSAGQTEAHHQEAQGQGHHTGEHEARCPQVKPGHQRHRST